MDQTNAFPETRTTPIIELGEIPPRRKPLKITAVNRARIEGCSPNMDKLLNLTL